MTDYQSPFVFLATIRRPQAGMLSQSASKWIRARPPISIPNRKKSCIFSITPNRQQDPTIYTGMETVVTHTHDLWRNSPWYSLDRRSCGPQCLSEIYLYTLLHFLLWLLQNHWNKRYGKCQELYWKNISPTLDPTITIKIKERKKRSDCNVSEDEQCTTASKKERLENL